MSTTYADFLRRKERAAQPVGREIDPGELHPRLMPFQRDIVTWAARVGRAGLWTDTGTGKTSMSLEWARVSGGTTLVVSPLGVAEQTVREAAKLDMEAHYVRSGDRITGRGVWVTNYEMVDRFDPSTLDCIPHEAEETPPGVSNDDWILWARPVWLDIRRGHTLNARAAREEADERHLHALQLDFIDRCVRLWSNPGDTVLSPFAGVGSEVYQAIKLGRRGVGIELKRSYFDVAVANLRELEAEMSAPSLFDTEDGAA